MSCTLVCSRGAFFERVEVVGSFQEVLEKVFPLQPPTSSIQARELQTWELEDGRHALIYNQDVVRVESD